MRTKLLRSNENRKDHESIKTEISITFLCKKEKEAYVVRVPLDGFNIIRAKNGTSVMVSHIDICPGCGERIDIEIHL